MKASHILPWDRDRLERKGEGVGEREGGRENIKFETRDSVIEVKVSHVKLTSKQSDSQRLHRCMGYVPALSNFRFNFPIIQNGIKNSLYIYIYIACLYISMSKGTCRHFIKKLRAPN